MSEPAVTLTDFALAALCAGFAWAIGRRGAGEPLRRWFALLFAFAAASTLLAGAVHGFLDAGSGLRTQVWRATLIAFGVVAFSAWGIGARLVLRPALARQVLIAAALLLLVYSGVVLWSRDPNRLFAVGIIHSVPPTLFLLAALIRVWRRRGDRAAALATIGLALSLLGAAAQQLGVSVHPRWLDHNALYHVVMAIAMSLIFVGARGLVRDPRELADVDSA